MKDIVVFLPPQFSVAAPAKNQLLPWIIHVPVEPGMSYSDTPCQWAASPTPSEMPQSRSSCEQALAVAERALTTFLSSRDRLLRLPVGDDVVAPHISDAEAGILRCRQRIAELTEELNRARAREQGG